MPNPPIHHRKRGVPFGMLIGAAIFAAGIAIGLWLDGRLSSSPDSWSFVSAQPGEPISANEPLDPDRSDVRLADGPLKSPGVKTAAKGQYADGGTQPLGTDERAFAV